MLDAAVRGRSADLRTIGSNGVLLSPMQRSILNLLARGFTGAQAAASLGLPPWGVQNRLQSLRTALDARTVTQAVLAGHRHGFLRRERYPRFELTGEQHELLGMVASGRSNEQIAAALGLAEAGHRLADLYAAMGVRNRPQPHTWASARDSSTSTAGRCGMARELQPCGTWGAYQWHRKNKIPVDDECQEACRRHNAEYRAANLEAVRAYDRERKKAARALKRQAVAA